jgi:hypothetical protein
VFRLHPALCKTDPQADLWYRRFSHTNAAYPCKPLSLRAIPTQHVHLTEGVPPAARVAAARGSRAESEYTQLVLMVADALSKVRLSAIHSKR